MSEHSASLYWIHLRVSLPLIRAEKSSNSSVHVLGENPAQSTLSFTKPALETQCYCAQLSPVLVPSVPCLTSPQSNTLFPSLLTAPLLSCSWHLSLSAQSFSACLWGSWQVLTQLCSGLPKPRRTSEETSQGAMLGQLDQELGDK